MRYRIKQLAVELLTLREFGSHPAAYDRAEVAANLILAFRHLEDASMRIGKMLQAFDGGVSVYDDSTTGRTNPQTRTSPAQPPARDQPGSL